MIRGAAVPVVDVDALLGGTASDRARFVLVRCGARAAALAVDAVLGVAPVDGSAPRAIALLQTATAGAVEALGALDRDLLVVLAAARVVPDGAWRAIGGAGPSVPDAAVPGRLPPRARRSPRPPVRRGQGRVAVARPRGAGRSARRALARRVPGAARAGRRGGAAALAERLTVGETYFFRNAQDMEAFTGRCSRSASARGPPSGACASSPRVAPPERSPTRSRSWRAAPRSSPGGTSASTGST